MNPRHIGRYEIRTMLGTGAQASVYRAYDPRIRREVALKLIHAGLATDPNYVARFEREARVIASLEHHSIVAVYDFGEDDGRPYLVMRLMAGGTLRERLDDGRLGSLSEASGILRDVADALDAAHASGVTHRDVKPANVLFDRDAHPYLSDFGIAGVADASTQLTATGVVAGTPAYMSPEQARGERATAASDIYSLAVVAFELVTGRVPFEGENYLSVLRQHVDEIPPAPTTINADVPSGCEASILRALAKSPADRFPTAAAFADAFQAGVQQASAEASPRPVVTPPAIRRPGAPTEPSARPGALEETEPAASLAETQPAQIPAQTVAVTPGRSGDPPGTPDSPNDAAPPLQPPPPTASRDRRFDPRERPWLWSAAALALLLVVVAVVATSSGTDSSTPAADEPPLAIAADDAPEADDAEPSTPGAAALSFEILPNAVAGSISVDPSDPQVGDEITLVARAEFGWRFDRWTGDRAATENPLIFALTDDASIQAVFVQTTTLEIDVVGVGSVESGGDLQRGPLEVDVGGQLELNAQPSRGWLFMEWRQASNACGADSGVPVGVETVIALVVNQATCLRAVFVEGVQLDVDQAEGGLIAQDPPGTTFARNSLVTLEALPASGWEFVDWSDEARSEQRVLSLRLNSDTNMTARFAHQGYLTARAVIEAEVALDARLTFGDRAPECRPETYRRDVPLRVVLCDFGQDASGQPLNETLPPQQAFFFLEGRYLGTATFAMHEGGIELAWQDASTVALEYGIYSPGDAQCCPRNQVTIRFFWNGVRLTPLDAIPSGVGMS